MDLQDFEEALTSLSEDTSDQARYLAGQLARLTGNPELGS